MKRKIAFLLVLLLIVPTFAMADETIVTAVGQDYEDVLFSNDYRGFCLDREKHGAVSGDSFSVADNTSAATDNIKGSGSDISQQLKILFTQCFEDIFVSDGNGGYQIKDTNTVQAVVWHYSEDQYIWGMQQTLADAVKNYSGPAIPDSGYTLTLDNGDVITFSFMVLVPENTETQYFFAYKLDVSQLPSHEHAFGEDWESDEDQHWHECECGEKTEVSDHIASEEVINRKDPTEFEEGYTGDTVCETCGEILETGEIIPGTHEHEFGEDWESDEDQHWHECECGEKADIADHIASEEVINRKEPTEFEEGYTGDTACEICDKVLKDGEPIPSTHEHEFGENWKSDEDEHWHECECGEKDDIADHTEKVINQKEPTEFEEGYTGDTVCEICDKVLKDGEPIPSNHEHEFGENWKSDEDEHWHECECGEKDDIADHTEKVINRKEPTEFEEGYTGDTVCDICDELLEKGKPVPATHEHSFGNNWETDRDKHWHECECGEKKDSDGHIYYNSGYCYVCGRYEPNYLWAIPNTGDNSSCYFVLCLLSFFGLAGVVYFGTKKKII